MRLPISRRLLLLFVFIEISVSEAQSVTCWSPADAIATHTIATHTVAIDTVTYVTASLAHTSYASSDAATAASAALRTSGLASFLAAHVTVAVGATTLIAIPCDPSTDPRNVQLRRLHADDTLAWSE